MKKSQKIFEAISYGVVIFVALVLVWFLIPVKNAPKLYTVLSGSMEPKIKVGSVAIVKPEQRYNVNDVITYKAGTGKGIPTTHRVIEVREESGTPTFITKGDANNAVDGEPVAKEAVEGKVLFSVPYLGYLLSFVGTKQGLIILVVIGTIIIYSEVMNIKKEVKVLWTKRKELMTKKKKKNEKTA